jgi:TonB family protein
MTLASGTQGSDGLLQRGLPRRSTIQVLRCLHAGKRPVLAPEEEGRSIDAMRFSLASDIVELVVLTGDDTFLQTLREAVGASRRLWHVPSSDKVSDLLVAGGVGILVLDTQALNEAANVFIAEIKRQFPDLIVMVAGRRAAETALAGAISDGTVYRFIHKPMSPGRARLFADVAVRKYEQRKRNDGAAGVIAATIHHRGALIGAACGALCAVLLGTIGLLRHALHDEASSQQSVKTAALAPTATPLLARAAVALAANRLTASGGDDALDLYLLALAGNPADADARAGLAEVRERLLARAENALLEERLDEASVAVETARKAGADSARLAVLSAQLGKAREQLKAPPATVRTKAAGPIAVPAAADTAEQFTVLALQRMDEGHLTDPERDNAQFYLQEALRVDPSSSAALKAQQALSLRLPQAGGDERERLLKSARERLEQDRLIEPANDSAKYYLLTLRGVDPSNVALAPLAQDLGARLIAKGRRCMELQQYEAARTWLEEALSVGYSSPDAAAALHDLDTALAQQALLANAVDASELKLLKSVRPVYPVKALRNAVEGWVEMEFTIAESGAVRGIAVRAANPPGVFEQAAVGALSQWRYQPILRGATPIAQRARIRIRFVLGP